MDNSSLKGRTAVVSGASRGLGRAIAVALAGAGVRVALVARNAEQLAATADAVKNAGSEAEVYSVDVTNEDQVRQLEKDVLARFGGVNILVNNAGMNNRKQLTEFSLAEWREVMDTNVTSAFLLSRAFIPHMKGKGYGRIINMSSMMAHVSLPARTAYSASKAALIGMTKALALELAPERITVVAISPGPFATEMNAPLLQNEEANRQFVARIPVGEWGKVEDIGQLALFLCSDAARFITGTDIIIDGGWTAQ